MLKKLILLACLCVGSLQADVSTVSLESVMKNNPRAPAFTVAVLGCVTVLATTKILQFFKEDKKELFKSIRRYCKYLYSFILIFLGIDTFISYRKAVAQYKTI